ncbi:HNH endonuclease [Clavibacter capsici]|uniref:HNH endonuclease n=1 Tax=Clavibacter capsici TaxID=1874630 RepID=UPI0035CAB507
MHLDHKCRVRNCVNPAHLEVVTPRENQLRGFGVSQINAVITHCPANHEYNPRTLASARRVGVTAVRVTATARALAELRRTHHDHRRPARAGPRRLRPTDRVPEGLQRTGRDRSRHRPGPRRPHARAAARRPDLHHLPRPGSRGSRIPVQRRRRPDVRGLRRPRRGHTRGTRRAGRAARAADADRGAGARDPPRLARRRDRRLDRRRGRGLARPPRHRRGGHSCVTTRTGRLPWSS